VRTKTRAAKKRRSKRSGSGSEKKRQRRGSPRADGRFLFFGARMKCSDIEELIELPPLMFSSDPSGTGVASHPRHPLPYAKWVKWRIGLNLRGATNALRPTSGRTREKPS
jgi:hypothetical protein